MCTEKKKGNMQYAVQPAYVVTCIKQPPALNRLIISQNNSVLFAPVLSSHLPYTVISVAPDWLIQTGKTLV